VAFTEWEIEGAEFVNCSCDCGCPCQFNSLPTHGHCHAHTFVRVTRGRYGDVTLDGLNWGIFAMWPGPIHLGNGTFRVVVDERADPRQRAALEAIGQGRDTEPGSLVWQVFSTTVTNLLPTLYATIELTIDVDERTASLHVPGVCESSATDRSSVATASPRMNSCESTTPITAATTSSRIVACCALRSSSGTGMWFEEKRRARRCRARQSLVRSGIGTSRPVLADS